MGFSMRVSIGVAPVQYGFCKGSMRLADGLQSWSRDSKGFHQDAVGVRPTRVTEGSYKGPVRVIEAF